jgi:Zn-dependent protease/CBS domain-containing protein
MNPTFTLGRIAGVRIGLNWSWAIVFALIVWSLADTVFPAQNPGFSTGAYVAMAVVAALLFFGSLLLHELGHAVQARREGMEVEHITLWLFGGVAQFKGEFPSAGAEFRVAIAGPVVTAFLGCSFLAVAAGTQLSSGVDGVAAWLAYINFILLVFNMVPALPLDGGRVLRSALWRARRDFGWATRTSVDVSRGFAFLLIVLGLLLVFAGDAVGGIWIAFIGWFLLQAATLEGRHLLVRDALAGLRVRDFMQPHPVVVPPQETLAELMETVAGAARFTAYPVVVGDRPVGVLPFSRVLATPWRDWGNRLVGDCMLPADEVATFAAGDAALPALETLAEGPLQRGLVVEDGRLVGLLSISDFARVLAAARRGNGARGGGS